LPEVGHVSWRPVAIEPAAELETENLPNKVNGIQTEAETIS
jgi:hypothetical protein